MTFKTISVIGLGYIGLPTAAMFASKKLKVIGVDVNEQAISTINQGKIHIVEPNLEEIVREAVEGGFLTATNKAQPADAFLIAVPTPFINTSDPSCPVEADLSYIKSAAKMIAPVLKNGDLIILESTSPVGATEQLVEWLANERVDLTFPRNVSDVADIKVAHCPERVLPGQVVRELVENDRVVGGITPSCSSAAVDLYNVFVKGSCVVTNARTAEMAKLTENSCRDVQIAFANELSLICDELDIDVWELISLANRHPRINILKPGPGVGGHCIAVDPWFIVSKTPSLAKLIRTARDINDYKPDWVVDKVKLAIADYLIAHPEKNSTDITISCFGLAFKPDIDDLRESPALEIVNKIAELKVGKLYAVEPNVDEVQTEDFLLVDTDTAVNDSNIVVLLVNHKEFRTLAVDSKQIVIDTIGLLKTH